MMAKYLAAFTKCAVITALVCGCALDAQGPVYKLLYSPPPEGGEREKLSLSRHPLQRPHRPGERPRQPECTPVANAFQHA